MDFAETKQKSRDEFDDFLSKVEQVGSILKDISSSDSERAKKGMQNADEYLTAMKKTEESLHDEDGNTINFSKTSLNKKALEDKRVNPDYSTMPAEDFMTAVEKDAKKRYQRRFK